MTPLSRILNHPLWLIALVLLTISYFGSGVWAHYEAEREAREQSVIAKLELTRVGQNVRVGGSSFLKTAERRGK